MTWGGFIRVKVQEAEWTQERHTCTGFIASVYNIKFISNVYINDFYDREIDR